METRTQEHGPSRDVSVAVAILAGDEQAIAGAERRFAAAIGSGLRTGEQRFGFFGVSQPAFASQFLRSAARELLRERDAGAPESELDLQAFLPPFPEDLYVATACAPPTSSEEAWRTLQTFFRPSLRAFAVDRFRALDADELLTSLVTYLWLPAPRGPSPLESYGGQGPLEGWLRRVLVTVAGRTLCAPRAKEPSGSVDVPCLAGGVVEEPAAAIARRELDAVLREEVKTAFASLEVGQANVLRWRVLDSLENREVARRVGVSAGQATRIYQAALGRMRVALNRALHARGLTEDDVRS
ncbi:MAG: hypothetical protein AB1486_07460 [Planctomycetota bacterium]